MNAIELLDDVAVKLEMMLMFGADKQDYVNGADIREAIGQLEEATRQIKAMQYKETVTAYRVWLTTTLPIPGEDWQRFTTSSGQ